MWRQNRSYKFLWQIWIWIFFLFTINENSWFSKLFSLTLEHVTCHSFDIIFFGKRFLETEFESDYVLVFITEVILNYVYHEDPNVNKQKTVYTKTMKRDHSIELKFHVKNKLYSLPGNTRKVIMQWLDLTFNKNLTGVHYISVIFK